MANTHAAGAGALRELLAKAGLSLPLTVTRSSLRDYSDIDAYASDASGDRCILLTGEDGVSAHLDLACAAINALPTLLDENDALRARADKAEELLRKARDTVVASTAESGVSSPRLAYRRALVARITAFLTPTPEPKR